VTILEEILSVSGKRLRRAAAVCIGLSVLATGGASAAVTLSDETETAIYLAELLRSARTVIANHQAHINDPAVGDKGLTGKVVLAKTRETFRQRTGKPLPLKDENDLRTRLLRAQLASIREVMDENQRTNNRTGIGFKGFVPDVSWSLPWGVLLWYVTLGSVIGVFGVFTRHPVLQIPMPWWVRAPFIGGWMNFVLVLFAYDSLKHVAIAVFGSGSTFVSPFWFVAEGAIVGAIIGYCATKLGGEGANVVDA
jgi:hypothetical protein